MTLATSGALGSAQAAFAQFVRRAIDAAKDQRRWSVSRLAEETGVGRSTLFRWLAGDWRDYPELEKVRAFCTTLGIPVTAAFHALDVHQERPSGIGALDPDIQVILDRLADPAVSAQDKLLIRQVLRYLARRPLDDQTPAEPATGATRWAIRQP